MAHCIRRRFKSVVKSWMLDDASLTFWSGVVIEVELFGRVTVFRYRSQEL